MCCLCDEISLMVCALKFGLCCRFVNSDIAQTHIQLIDLRRDIPGIEKDKPVVNLITTKLYTKWLEFSLWLVPGPSSF